MDRIYSDCEYVMSYAHELAECSKGTYEFGRGGSHMVAQEREIDCDNNVSRGRVSNN